MAATHEETYSMVSAAWTYMSWHKLSIQEFVEMLRDETQYLFPEQEKEGIRHILGYIAECRDFPDETTKYPVFQASAVKCLDRILSEELDREM